MLVKVCIYIHPVILVLVDILAYLCTCEHDMA